MSYLPSYHYAPGAVPAAAHAVAGGRPVNPERQQVAWSVAAYDNPDEVRPCTVPTKKGGECPAPPASWENGVPIRGVSACQGHWQQLGSGVVRGLIAAAGV